MKPAPMRPSPRSGTHTAPPAGMAAPRAASGTGPARTARTRTRTNDPPSRDTRGGCPRARPALPGGLEGGRSRSGHPRPRREIARPPPSPRRPHLPAARPEHRRRPHRHDRPARSPGAAGRRLPGCLLHDGGDRRGSARSRPSPWTAAGAAAGPASAQPDTTPPVTVTGPGALTVTAVPAPASTAAPR